MTDIKKNNLCPSDNGDGVKGIIQTLNNYYKDRAMIDFK